MIEKRNDVPFIYLGPVIKLMSDREILFVPSLPFYPFKLEIKKRYISKGVCLQ